MGKAATRPVASRRRVRLDWHPEWDGTIRAYTIKFIHENKWRYDPRDELSDHLQDAYIVFQRVADRYPLVVNPRHFMALYKTALFNEFVDKANANILRKTVFADFIETDVSELTEKITCNLAEDGAMTLLLASAPPEVRLFLSVFTNQDHLLELRKPHRRIRGFPRESFNHRIKRILGLESDADLVAAFMKWITA